MSASRDRRERSPANLSPSNNRGHEGRVRGATDDHFQPPLGKSRKSPRDRPPSCAFFSSGAARCKWRRRLGRVFGDARRDGSAATPARRRVRGEECFSRAASPSARAAPPPPTRARAPEPDERRGCRERARRRAPASRSGRVYPAPSTRQAAKSAKPKPSRGEVVNQPPRRSRRNRRPRVDRKAAGGFKLRRSACSNSFVRRLGSAQKEDIISSFSRGPASARYLCCRRN